MTDIDISGLTWGEVLEMFRGSLPKESLFDYGGCGTHMVILTVPDSTPLTKKANTVSISTPEERPLTPAEQATEASDRTFGF